MPQPVPYDVFLANVNENDLALMTDFIQGTRVSAADGAEADALFAEAERLYNAGMVHEVHRIFKEVNGVTVQQFDGFVTDVGKGYIARLAKERVLLSRDPIPEPEA